MVFADLLTLVGSYAFPIVMCIDFFWKLDKEEERHKEEMDGLRKTIEDNTNILDSLKDLIQIVINKEK